MQSNLIDRTRVYTTLLKLRHILGRPKYLVQILYDYGT